MLTQALTMLADLKASIVLSGRYAQQYPQIRAKLKNRMPDIEYRIMRDARTSHGLQVIMETQREHKACILQA